MNHPNVSIPPNRHLWCCHKIFKLKDMGVLKEMMWDRLGAICLLVWWDLGLKVGALELGIIE